MWESMLINISVLLVLIIVTVYFMLKKRYNYFRSRGIAYIEPVFLLGSMPKAILLQETIGDGLTKMYKRSPPDAPVVGLFQFHLPIYMIKDPDLVQRVLIKDFAYFHDRGFDVNEETNPLENNLFNMRGTKWRALRNKLTPTFTSSKLKGMLPLMDAIVDQLLDVLDEHVGQDIEMKDICSRLTTDIIGSSTFGIDAGSIKNPKSQFRMMGERVFRPSLYHFMVNAFRLIYPSIPKTLKLKTIADDISSFYMNITRQSMDHRIRSGEKRNDFLQLLMELRLKGEVLKDSEEHKDEDDKYLYHEVSSHLLEDAGKLVINDNVLAAQAFVFLLAGYETSAATLAFITYLLSKHQVVQEKLRREVREMVVKHGGFTYQALKAMPYLSACINEGLRMYPPVPVLFRKCTTDYSMDGGAKIEKGNFVYIPVSALMMDENYYPNPEEFRPERFLERDPIPGTFIPFGDGPRICIAQRFAQLEVKLALAKMVDRYRIETCPKMAANEPLKFNPKSLIPLPIGGIHCRFTLLTSL